MFLLCYLRDGFIFDQRGSRIQKLCRYQMGLCFMYLLGRFMFYVGTRWVYILCTRQVYVAILQLINIKHVLKNAARSVTLSQSSVFVKINELSKIKSISHSQKVNALSRKKKTIDSKQVPTYLLHYRKIPRRLKNIHAKAVVNRVCREF